MGRLLRCAIVLLLADITMVKFRVFARTMSSVAESFTKSQIVPDVIPSPPCALATVKYKCHEVKEGNELTPTQVKDIPNVTWDSDHNQFYTLAMIDPDAPSRVDPIYRAWRHWLVGNIPGDNVSAGDTLAEYIGAAPPEGTGFHRYVFLVYQQPGKLTFDEKRLNDTSQEGRVKFSVTQFATKYNLGQAFAGNFYLAQYDDYVLVINKQIGA